LILIDINIMSFRGGRGGGGKGSFGGRGGGKGGKGGKGGGRGGYDEGPPAEICEVGVFLHGAEEEMVCRLTNVMIPYFNAGIYLENKSKIGKVEEVFGPINKVYFTIKPDSGVKASSFEPEDKVFIGTDKLLPLSRFTNEGAKKSGGGKGGGKGGKGGGRGGKGGKGGGKGKGFGGRGGGKGGGFAGRGIGGGRGRF
jgi:H/ACA ribonucleoprotein complex subunit 1